MITLEELQVVIKANTASLKESMQGVVSELQQIQDNVSNELSNVGKISKRTANDVTNQCMKVIDEAIDITHSKLVSLGEELIDVSNTAGWDSEAAQSIGSLSDSVEQYYKELLRYKDELQKGGLTLPTISTPTIPNADTASRLPKQLLAGFVGVRSIYMLVRKLVSQNQVVSNSINNLITTIGNLLEPLFNFIAAIINSIAQLIGRIFKVNTSNAKSNAATAKNTASFDEINNLDESSVSTSSAKVKIPSLKEAWENMSGIGKAVTIILGAIAAIKSIGLIKDLIQGISTIKTLLSPLFKSIMDFFASKIWTTILGIAAVVGGIALSVTNVVKMWKNGWSLVGEILKDVGIAIAAVGAIILGAPAVVAGVVAGIVAIVSSLVIIVHDNWDKIKSFTTNIWANIKTIIGNTWNGIKQLTVNAFTSLKSSLSNIWNGIWSIIKGIINKIISGIESMVNRCVDGINSLTSGLRKLGNSVLSAIGISSFSFNGLSHINLPKLETGTNYVPNNMIAMLHKGEAVVPKKYNDNNAETNALLKQLIKVVDSKEFKAYISKSDVGKASVDYIKQQSRILGGSIV